MNEYGVDSLALSSDHAITQAQVDLINYLGLKAGVYSSLPSDVNTSAFWNQTFTTFQYVQPGIHLMKQNGKPTMVYFFSYAWSYAAAQYEATLACDAVDQWTDKPDWPLFIDWETTGYYDHRAGAYEALIMAGITPTASILHDVINGWYDTIRSRGYNPGLYTGGAMTRDIIGDGWLQAKRAQGLYYWEAAYNNIGPMQNCDIWQKSDSGDLLGTVVDDDYIRDDRIWNISGAGLPIWLKLYLANRGDTHGKHTLLL